MPLSSFVRTRDERPKHPGHWDIFKDVVENTSIPIIANGDVFQRSDIDKLKEMSSEFNLFNELFNKLIVKNLFANSRRCEFNNDRPRSSGKRFDFPKGRVVTP